MANQMSLTSSVNSGQIVPFKKYEKEQNEIAYNNWVKATMISGLATTVAYAAKSYLGGSLVADSALLISGVVFGSNLLSPVVNRVVPNLPPKLKNVIQSFQTVGTEFLVVPKVFYATKNSYFAKDVEKLTELTKHPKKPINTPILLVHGFQLNSGAWFYIKGKLEAEGLGPVYTIDLGSEADSIDDHAKKVDEMAKLIAKAHGTNKLITICHSMGGLVATQYATKYAPQDSVEEIITMGTPAQGTIGGYYAVAKTFGKSKSAKEMTPHNKFVENLENQLEQSQDFKLTQLRSETDEFIIPRANASFINGKKVIIDLEQMGHTEYLFSGKVVDTLIALLKKDK